ncbi:pectinesterase [Canna indica]|uniref:Pectinesterase n=1 Tax=Canna indica TaxID=4628 RepID=A0AAQ3K000_9LILI|nr:pectinesterase [Canna indica]
MAVVPNTLSPSQVVEALTNMRQSEEEKALGKAREALIAARNAYYMVLKQEEDGGVNGCSIALSDCARLYEDSERRLRRRSTEAASSMDVRMWLSAALTNHQTCIEGLRRGNVVPPATSLATAAVLREALALHSLVATGNDRTKLNSTNPGAGLMISWHSSKSKVDIVVAQDGSGNYKTINEALAALGKWNRSNRRLVVYVKSGTYKEYVRITVKNIMLVGDGIDKTIVTGSRSVPDGYSTLSSATFAVTGDNFWARDMTFENTAGPGKHQAVALMVASDRSIFYRCSFRGYQDTLLAHSLRQFYRDCEIHGTIDFIFGNAAVVLQNCDIYVRRPLPHQANLITAQGRDDPHMNTGISVHGGRVRAARELEAAKNEFRSYLGRPWKKYSRTVFLKTDLDGIIQPEGWARWSGDFALETLFYGEYKNTGEGAATGRRVKWPGVHVMADAKEAAPFTVEWFLEGREWIGEAGVPFWSGL